MVAIAVKNNGNETVWLPNGALGIGIENLDTGKKYGIISTQALISLDPGQSKSTAWDQNDGGEGEQAIPGNYRTGVSSGSFADFKIQKLLPPPLPPPQDNVVIVTEINTQIRNYYNTITTSTPTSCTTPQESTIALGPGSIASKGVRVLAAFDPCILNGGGAVLNLPDSNNNLKLVALDIEGGSTHKAVEVSLQKINTITDDQTFYNAQFTRSMTGMSPITNKIDTIQDINSLVLLNDSPRRIDFVSDNSMGFNAVLSPN